MDNEILKAIAKVWQKEATTNVVQSEDPVVAAREQGAAEAKAECANKLVVLTNIFKD